MNRKTLVKIMMIVMLISIIVINIGAEEDKDTPPVTKVVLYKHGMGYFERVGKIKDSATVTLDFKTSQMQDLLTSLFAIDYGKDCKITSIGYDSKDPIDKQLENILIRVPENAALTQFLTQLKGVRAEIKIGVETARGSILGIEPVIQKMDNTAITGYKVVFLTEDGLIQPFNLLEVSSLKILDERIQEDLTRILDIYRNAKYTDRKRIRINTVGKGERNIQIGYLVEMPIWKTSYRLILGDDVKPYLQGWAIMENPTDEDWKDVQISFVAGNPISFVLDLYTSYYPQRPVIRLETLIPLASNLIAMGRLAEADKSSFGDMGFLADSNEMSDYEYAPQEGRVAMRAKGGGRAPAAPGAVPNMALEKKNMSEMLSQSISAIASGTQIGELFAYESKTPITVNRRQAAMVPIVTEYVNGSKILYYKQAISPRLMNAFYLTNSSKLTLETGPVNIFEGSTAVGEGLIRTALQPDMKEIIPFAIEAGCNIEKIDRSEYKPYHKASFVNGVMILKQYYVRETVYKCVNKTSKSFTMYLDHQKAGDYTLMEPSKFEEELVGYYRFKNELGAGKSFELKVVEQREMSSDVYIQNQALDNIRFYLSQGYVSKQAKDFLKDVIALMNKIAEQDGIISDARKETEKLAKEQERYRENMKILNVNNPKEMEKRAEYLERLSKNESRIEALDQVIRDATEKQRQIRQELVQKIQAFSD